MTQRVKGAFDVIPECLEKWRESHAWQHFESVARDLAALYGFQEIRTPVFEYTEVFTRSAGEESDVVLKEMYTFFDKAERSLSLRPELTAPIVRAYIENGLQQMKCDRFFYIGPCFRYDRMQKGRYRQFHQFGAELFGPKDPYLDVETIHFLMQLYKKLGLKNTALKINSIGDKEIREEFARALQAYFTPFTRELSPDSQRRLTSNPLRILDSKDERDREIAKNAPQIAEFLTPYRRTFFEDVLKGLSSLDIPYVIEPSLVRGLDYYCDTVFEVVATTDLGAQNALGGGGRYDGLMKDLGGPDLPGFGFATGIERVLLSMIAENSLGETKNGPDFYLIPLSPASKEYCFLLMKILREEGKSALLHTKNFALKKGLSDASDILAKKAIIIGEEELKTQIATIKCLSTRAEEKMPFSKILKNSILIT